MKVALVAAFITIALVQATPFRGGNETRIENGKTVKKRTYSYMTSLRIEKEGTTVCGGTLIGKRHVLSSVLCLNEDSPNLKWASVGTHYNSGSSDGVQREIAKIIRHPHDRWFTNSFIIIELKDPVPERFAPVAIDGDNSEYTEGTTLGYSAPKHHSIESLLESSHELQRVDLQILSSEKCKMESEEAYIWFEEGEDFICAQSDSNAHIGSEDWGGPLIVAKGNKNVLVGVAAVPLDDTDDLTAFFRVSHAISFIQQYVEDARLYIN
jgi:secreted trypsin-like serine protease